MLWKGIIRIRACLIGLLRECQSPALQLLQISYRQGPPSFTFQFRASATEIKTARWSSPSAQLTHPVLPSAPLTYYTYPPPRGGGARESRASPSLAAMPGRSWPKKSQKSQGGLVQCMTQPHKKGSPRRVLSSRHPQKVKPTQQIERRGGREEFFHTLCPPQSWWGIESWGVVCPMATMAAHAHSPVQPRTLPLYQLRSEAGFYIFTKLHIRILFHCSTMWG